MPQRPLQYVSAFPGILRTAGIWHLAYGIALAGAALSWPDPDPLGLRASGLGAGLAISAFGVGYLWAAGQPARDWWLILAGFLGKLLAAGGLVWFAGQLTVPWPWLALIAGADLVWALPLGAVLYGLFRTCRCPRSTAYPTFAEALAATRSHRGASLLELSRDERLMLIFLRHAGSPFSREALAELAAHRGTLEADGLRIAIVHMESPLQGRQLCARYGLEDLHRFSDPGCRLYRTFELRRGNFRQIFGWAVWRRGLCAALIGGHGLGRWTGDCFQLPGVFVLESGRIVAAFRAARASDRPDYDALARGAGTRSIGAAALQPERDFSALAHVA